MKGKQHTWRKLAHDQIRERQEETDSNERITLDSRLDFEGEPCQHGMYFEGRCLICGMSLMHWARP